MPLPVRISLVAGLVLAPSISAQKQGGGNPPPPTPPSVGSLMEPGGKVHLSYALDAQYGLVFTYVGDALEPQAHVFEPTDPWRVELRDVNSGITYVFGPSDCTFDFSAALTTSHLWARWDNCVVQTPPAGSPALPPFDVSIDAVAPSGDTMVSLDIGVDFSSADVSLYSVFFPRFRIQERNPGMKPATNQIMTWPKQGGLLYPDPMHSTVFTEAGAAPAPGLPKHSEFVHPGQLSMQFFAYYNDNEEPDPACLMVGTRDLDGHWKEYLPPTQEPGSPAALNLQLRQVPGDHLTLTSYESPYPAVVGVIRGDWYDACREYRGWATGPSVPWSAATPMYADQTALPLERRFSQILADTEAFGLSIMGSCLFLGSDGELQRNFLPSTLSELTDDIEDQKTFLGVQDLTTVVYKWDAHSLGAFPGIYEPVQPAFLSQIPGLLAAGLDFAFYFNPNRATLSSPFAPQNRLPGDFFPAVRVHGSPTPLVNDVLPFLAQGVLGQYLCYGGPCDITSVHTRDQDCPNENLLGRLTYLLDQRSPFVYDYATSWIDAFRTFGAGGTDGPKGIYMDYYTHQNPVLSYGSSYGETGGGKRWSAGKLDTLSAMRVHARMAEPEFFVYSEGHQEMYNNLVELVFADHLFGEAQRYACDGTPLRIITPLFLTVYHDYQLTLGAAPLNGPSDPSTSGSADFMRRQRQRVAAQLYFGHVPGAGSYLSAERLSRGASLPGTPYGLFTQALQDMYSVVTDAEAREFLVFGERWRDPEAPNAALVDDGCRPTDYLPFGQEQPFVYVSAFGRTDLGARSSLGVLLVNWSQPGDPAGTLGQLAGDQVIQFEIDPVEYGLTGDYRVRDVGAPPGVATTETFGASPISFSRLVPAGGAVFVLFEPI